MTAAYLEDKMLKDLRDHRVEWDRRNQRRLLNKIRHEYKEYSTYQQLYKAIDTRPLLRDMRENDARAIRKSFLTGYQVVRDCKSIRSNR